MGRRSSKWNLFRVNADLLQRQYSEIMRPLLLTLLPALLSAATALEIIRPIVSQMDGGPPEPAGFENVAGETLWVMCRVAGYSKSEDQRVQLKYSVQAFDQKGIPLDEPYTNEMNVELSAQDKEWLPKLATSVAIPPLAGPGAYKILVKVEDALAKTTAELSIPFKVRGHAIEVSDTVVARNFQFFRDEDGTRRAEPPVYKPGDGVFAKFDITGYKLGEKNKINVSYVISVIAPSGKALWTQPDATTEQSESFYPKAYVPAMIGINLQKTIRPGEYAIRLQLKDAIGGQTYEGKFPFTIE